MSKDLVVGIDPGVSCGLAVVQGGAVTSMRTFHDRVSLFLFVQENMDSIAAIGVEDSRLQTHIFSAKGRHGSARQQITRSIGSIDERVASIEEVCLHLGITFVPISPQEKGKKYTHEQLGRIAALPKTTSNQHERDAATVALNAFRKINKQR